jgi:hypothetical protein
MRFTRAWITRALRNQNSAIASELREVKMRVFKRKSSKPIVAGIALTVVGISTAVAFALAVDPGANSKIDYSMGFNGSDTYAHTDSQVIPNGSDFTIEAFFKSDPAVSSNLGWIVGGGKSGDTTNSWGILAGMADADAGGCVMIATPDGFTDCLAYQARVPSADWVHVSLTYTSSTATYRAYINGVLLQTNTITNTSVGPGFNVGRSGKSATDVPYGQPNSYFKGQIDEVKVFNTVRSTANMLTDTYTYLSPATSGLLAQYDFNEGQFGFGTISDRTTNNFDLSINGTTSFSDIAQYTNTSRTTNMVRFNRSYITAAGGWSSPAGVTTLSGTIYGAGGGGGGGAAEAAGNGGGGGGGAPGNKAVLSNSATSNQVFVVRVGVGGVGGTFGYTGSPGGGNGTTGQQSTFNTTNAVGGGGGFGGGYATGTATYTAGLGGKGGTSGTGFAGSSINNTADGGAAGSYSAAVTNNIRAGASGITDITAAGTYLKPGDGGYGGGNVNAYIGANGLLATGSGGNGGGGGTTAGSFGGFGASGTIIVTYAINSTTQDFDYLYSFNGTNQYAETPTSSTALDVTGNFTLEAWVNPTNICATGFCTIAGRENDYLLATSNGTYWWRIADSSSASTWYNTGVAFTTGQWQHVALVRSGTSVLLYANGQLMSTQSAGDNDASGTPISLTATTLPGPGWFQLAARGLDHTDMFNGGIDEVRVWNIVRTASEIGDGSTGDFNRPLNSTELGSSGLLAYWDMNDTQTAKIFINRKTAGTPASDLGWSGALTAEQNNRSVQITNRYLTVASANSTAAYGVDSPSFELTGSNFTVSGWWQIPSCAATNYLISKGNTYSIATDSACKINVQLDPGNEGDGQTWQWMNTGYVMSTATWNYVSVIKTGTTMKLYVNGALATTINDGDSVQSFNSAGNVTAVVPANLGNRNTYFGVGSTGVGSTRANIASQFIDDIRLWNTDRSSKQSFDMAGFVPHTQAGLQALFDFNTLQATALVVPNTASVGASESTLTVASTLTSGVSSSSTPPNGQPVRYQQYMQRSLIKSSTLVGGIPAGATSAEYWVAGGGGGGGSGGTSGYTGAGGGAGGLLEGTVSNLTNGIPSETVTTLKVGVGGRYAINNGDSVNAVATNGTSSSFLSTGVTVTAIGGGAGGSGTTNPSPAPQGLDGGSGGGSAQTGGAGGSATQGYAGGAGSSAASGGGGGTRTAGGSASAGNGGSGGKGFLLPLANSVYSQYPVWVGGGGSGFGTSSSSNANSAFAATSANTDAAAYSGSGGGGAGFAASSNGTSRGGYGANGYVLINYAMASPYVDSGPTSLQSGQPASTPVSLSLRDINGDVLTTQTGSGSLAAVSGCTLLGSYSSVAFTAGRATIPGLTAYSTSATNCELRFSYSSVTPASTFVFKVPIRTSPASITINTSATSGVCAFVSGTFSCPDNTAAILNVNDLNAQLNSNDVTLVTRGGDITINSAVSGSTGALNLSAYGAVKMNAGIALTGLNKALTVQSLNQIVGNESATIGSPTAFSTNGGAMYLYTGMGTASTAGFVKLSNYNTFTTNGGAFVVSGGSDPTTGYATGNSAAITTDITANGIYMNTGATISSGAGNITLRGQLYGSRTLYSTPGSNQAGITLLGGISSTSGSITLVGTVANLMNDQTYRNGIYVSAATISSDSGDISISGESTLDAANTFTSGIYISGSSITSNSGNVTATGNTPTNSAGIIKFVTPQSTLGSQTGNVTLTAPATLARVQNFDFMKLTGGGTHSLLFNYPIFATSTTSLQALGTGGLVVSPVGARAFAASISIPTSFDTGTGYKTITIGDNPATPSQSQTLGVSATLIASEYVSLKALSVTGPGSVTSPGLAIVARSVSLTATANLTGASDVDTLAITHGNASYGSGTVVGIADADGWTPGTVAGVTGVYGVAKNVAFTTLPSSSAAKNQVLPVQPVVRLSDAYGFPLNSSNLSSSNYTATPSIISGTPANALTPTTPVTFSNGSATFSGLKFTSNTTYGLALTVSPALAGTSTVSSSITVAAYAAPTSITVSPTSLNATSGSLFSTMPTVTYWDPYGNPSGTVNGTGAPSVALTSYPAGASAASLTSGSFTTGTNGGTAAGSNFKLTGPSGTYVLTVTGTYTGTTTSTATITVDLLGWSVSYGASSLNYSTTPYSPTFTGNGTGAVTYATSTGAICSVNASTGDMTPITAGTCTITASQAADGTYSAGSASVSVTIVAGPQPMVTISASPTDLTYLGSTTLTGGGGAGTGAFTYAKTAGNCTISGAVLSYGTAHAGDTCSVAATRALTTGKYTATTSTALVITVVKAAQSTAVVVPSGRTAGYSNTVDLATFTYSGGNGTGAYVFSTATPNCSITGTVLTSFATVGTNCAVSVRRDTSTDYLISNPVTMNVQTTKGSQSVSFVTIASAVRVADSVTLSATASSGLSVTYSLGVGSSAYCSLTAGVVTFTSPGSCVVKADQAGDANVNAAATQTLTYTVSKGLQTITFAPIADDAVRTTTLSLAATSSATLAVTYSLGANTTNSACTVTSSGMVSLSAVGTCEITASQGGSANYEAATDVSQSFHLDKGTQTDPVITNASHVAYGQTVALTATGGNGTGDYGWSVLSGTCSIASGTTTLTLGDAGSSCQVVVSRAGDANWFNSGGSSLTIHVDKASQTALSITNPNAVVYGNQLALTYGGGSGIGSITWSATTPCSVNGTNLTVGNAGVSCVVTLSKDGDDNYLAASATMTISVTRAQQAPVTITSSDHVTYRQTLTLSATGGSGTGTISFAATGACSITGGNVLSVGVAGSSCSVTATRSLSTNYDAQSSTAMTITIDKADQVIGAISISGMARALGAVPISATSDSGLIVTLTVDSSSAAVCSINATVLSFATSGDCVINANQPGDTNFNAATQVQRTILVDHAGQTINLVNPGSKRYLGANFQVVGSASSSLPITYSLGSSTTQVGQNSTICSVSATGTVQIFEIGTCEVLADQAGDGVYGSATQASVTFAIDKAEQSTIAVTSAGTYVFGSSLQLGYTGGDGAGAVTFETGAGQDCSIDPATNIISGGGAGSDCTVRVLKAGDAHYEAAQSGTEQIVISQASQTINFSSSPNNPTALGTYTVSAIADSGEQITFSIDPASSTVCSVFGDTVTLLTSGTCVILADQAGNTNFGAAPTGQQSFSVAHAAQTLSVTTPTNVTFGDAPFVITNSSSSYLNPSFTLVSGPCTVSQFGQVFTTGAGHCHVTASLAGDDVYDSAADIEVEFDIAKGQQYPLTAMGFTPVTYGQSFNPGFYGGSGNGAVDYETRGTCSVLAGVLTVGDAGSLCEFRVTNGGDADYEPAVSDWFTVVVNRASQAPLTITSSTVVTYGQTLQIDVSGGDGPSPITYSTTGTCTVSSSGLLTPGNAGSSCTVKATKAQSTNYLAESSLDETITVWKADQAISFTSSPSNAVALSTYSVTASADSGDNVTFSIDPASSSVCSVNGSTVSFLTSGSCVVEANQAGNVNYNPAPTGVQMITVDKALQNVTYTNPGNHQYGGADFQISASSDSGLQLAFSVGQAAFFGVPGQTPPTPSCSVSATGLVTILEIGPCEINVDQVGNDIYHPVATIRISFQVTRANQAALSMSSASSVGYGGTISLATSGGSGTGNVTYATTGTCNAANGVLTVGEVGDLCTVTATKADDTHYLPASSSAQTITVTKANQVALSITSASSVVYGGTITLAVTGGSGPTSVSYSTTGTCSVSAGVLTVGNAGSSCTVTATNAASKNYEAVSSAAQTVTITKAANTVRFTSAAVNPRALGTYRMTASADSGDNVSFAISAGSSSVCAVSGSTVSFLTSGDCVIDASEDGNDNFNAAPTVQQTVAVAHASQTITFTAVGTKRFGGADFSAQASSTSGLTITYSRGSGTTNTACSVTSDGTVTILDVGNCQITANQAGNIVYSAATAVNQDVTIGKGAQPTLVMTSSSTDAFGDLLTLTASGGSGTGTVTFAATGDCTVSNGILTVGVVGSSCSVTATKSGDSQYDPISSVAQTVTVIRGTQAALTMNFASTQTFGTTQTLSTSGGSGDGAVTYVTTGTCSVTNGVLHVGNVGSTCTVTATKAQSANYLAASTSAQTITVTKANQTVSITSTASNPTALGSYTLVASADSGLSADVTVDPASSTVCSISGTTVSFLTSGSCALLADQAGNTNFNAASQVSQTITVAKHAQIITATTIARHYFGEANFTVPASSGSGLALGYALGSATTNNACSVNASTGVVSILATGTCSIDLDQAGNSIWAPAARVNTSFAIGKADQAPLVITNATPVTFGDVVNLVTSGGSVNGVAVTYSTTGTCSVTGAQLTFGDAGSACTVTAFLDGNDQYNPVSSATVTVAVGRAEQPAFGLGNTFVIVYGHTVQLTPWGGAGDGAVTYDTVGNCSVSVDILTFSGSAGEYCLITARKAASLNYNAAVDSQRTFSVSKDNQTISVTATPGTAVALGTYNFAATATSGLSVTASIASASQTVCSISGNTVTYLTAGDCEVIASQSGNTNYNAASSVSQHITVAKKAQTITFPQIATQQFGAAAVSLTASAQSTLQVTYAVDSATTNNSCSVDNNNQTVSLLGAGDCYLTADQAGNDTWSTSAQAAMHFTITRGNQASVSITSGSSVVYGNTLSLTAIGGSGAGSFAFATTGTCTVSGSTLTVGDAGSSCAVTATKAQDTNYLAKTSVAQTITITRATQASLVLSSIASVTYGQTLALATTGGSGTGAVTYTASGSCAVSGSTLTGGAAGSNCAVYATKAQSTNYNSIDSAISTQSVAKSSQTINLSSSPSSPTALGSYTVVANASSGLTPIVSVDNASSSVCSVSAMVVSFLTSGSCAIFVDQSGNSNFNAATQVPQTITVAKAAQTITFSQPADVAMYATAPNFGATASSGLTVSYAVTSNGTAACSVTSGGALTAIAPGLCEISVSQAGNSIYAPALDAVRSFNIIRAGQSTLTITSNSSVDYLGSITLSATGGSGTGAISFTANGTCSIANGVLTVGEVGSNCSVTATRAGDTYYNAATSASQSVTVNQINQDAIIVVSAAHVRFGQTLPLVSAGGSGSGAESWSVDTANTVNSAGCSINGGTLNLTATTSGACDIVVTKAASRNYRSAVSPRLNVTVNKAYQSISFTSSVPTQPVSGDTYTVSATSTSSLSVAYSVASGSANYCSIAGAVVTFTATGDCVINANQVGDGRFLAAPTASQTITVDSLNQEITASSVRDHKFGDPAFVIVGETTSTSAVTFGLGSNTTANACLVTSSGVVSILAVGHCEIVLSAASDATYAAASDLTRNFEVVADQASAPFVTSVSADNQSVTLSFSAPSYFGGSPIRAYGINAYRNGVLAASSSGCASTDTSCTITGLTNGLAYSFRMVAINAAGDGVESASVGPVTPVTHAEAVQRLTAIGVNTALDVTWLAPASLGGGTFDSYRIYVRVRGGSYPSTPTEVIYDGTQTSKQITGLVNGTSYDVKVVTITTANAAQLVSNTAEVLQYPKTIPDAPQSVSLAPISASNLLVSWTAPISDGGDAISAYTARIAGGPNCTVAATSNACEVAGLVPGTVYTIDVFATNSAGDSSATIASITFRAATVAGANQHEEVSSGGSAGPTNPVVGDRGEVGSRVHEDLWISLDKIATAALNGSVDGVTISGKLGGKATFTGKGLDAVRSAYIGDHIPVKILKSTDTELVVQLPGSKIAGWQDMWFFVDSHAIRYVDVVRYGVLQPSVVKWVKGYKVAPKQLTNAQKVQIKKYLKAVGKYKRVDCAGSYKAIHMTCKYIKTLRPAGYVHITTLKLKPTSTQAKVVKLTFSK